LMAPCVTSLQTCEEGIWAEGTIFRAAVLSCSKSEDPQMRELHGLLVNHPNLRDLLPQ
jgi:hypothetical protein